VKKLVYALTVLSLMAFAISCENNEGVPHLKADSSEDLEDLAEFTEQIPTDQKVFYVVEWQASYMSTIHTAYIFDVEGNVYTANFESGWTYTFEDDVIPAEDMDTEFELVEKQQEGTIDIFELQTYNMLIDEAALGNLSERTRNHWDCGYIYYSAFTYDHVSKSYKRVRLKENGDFVRENDSPEAQRIYQWLDDKTFQVIGTFD
jgi:hypothetical protein